MSKVGGGGGATVSKMKMAQGSNDGYGSHVAVKGSPAKSLGVHGAHKFMMGGTGKNVLASDSGKSKGKNSLKGID